MGLKRQDGFNFLVWVGTKCKIQELHLYNKNFRNLVIFSSVHISMTIFDSLFTSYTTPILLVSQSYSSYNWKYRSEWQRNALTRILLLCLIQILRYWNLHSIRIIYNWWKIRIIVAIQLSYVLNWNKIPRQLAYICLQTCMKIYRAKSSLWICVICRTKVSFISTPASIARFYSVVSFAVRSRKLQFWIFWRYLKLFFLFRKEIP